MTRPSQTLAESLYPDECRHKVSVREQYEEGRFDFSTLPSGKYAISISSSGFITFNERNIHVKAHRGLQLSVVMQVGMTAVAMLCGESISAAASCDSLRSLSLARTTITSAQVVAAGAFAPSLGAAGGPAREFPGAKTLPEFCRVQGVSKPSTDSHVEFEVWLPVSGWNGKYQGAGNGWLCR